MKGRRDRKLFIAPTPEPARLALDDDAELARALRALALDRPSPQELQRVRQHLELALTKHAQARSQAAGMNASAGLVLLGAALLSVLPSSAHLTRREAPPLVAAASLAEGHSAATELARAPLVAPCPPLQAQSPAQENAQQSTAITLGAQTRRHTRRLLPARASEAHAGSGDAKPPFAARGTTQSLQPISRADEAERSQLRQPTLSKPPIVPPVSPVASSTAAADEATLLQQARRRAHTDPAAALRWLDEHKHRFPHGSLSQEREVMAIQLLRAQSHEAEAEQRAREFRREFPHSIYLSGLAEKPAK